MGMANPAPSNPSPPAELRRSSILDEVIEAIAASYPTDPLTSHIDATFLPSRARTIEAIELTRRVVFPGFFDQERITTANAHDHLCGLLSQLDELLYDQVRQSLRYGENRTAQGAGDSCDHCDVKARDITDAFLRYLPELRRMLSLDIQAAFDGDPAATNTDEAIFCYPGIDAIFIHRVAHQLCKLGVPMLPRIMSECAHNETGVDIHPGATIGESFFIDHGTGVVIGETCEIGKRVKIYQGVTLGALSTKGGQAWRGRKRHPTLEDDVTIYAGATILGGGTVIGARSTIAGSVFITESVPADHTVMVERPTPQIMAKRNRRSGDQPEGESNQAEGAAGSD